MRAVSLNKGSLVALNEGDRGRFEVALAMVLFVTGRSGECSNSLWLARIWASMFAVLRMKGLVMAGGWCFVSDPIIVIELSRW